MKEGDDLNAEFRDDRGENLLPSFLLNTTEADNPNIHNGEEPEKPETSEGEEKSE